MTLACQPPDAEWRPLKVPPPAGSTDCHVHIMGPFDKFRLSKQRGYTPEECPIETFQGLMKTIGIDRAVVVQGSAHGNDNRVTVDAVRKLGKSGRGVVLVSPDIPDNELIQFKEDGISGLRLSSTSKAGYGMENLPLMAERARELDWMVLLHFSNIYEIIDLTASLEAIPGDFIIDHQGRPKAAETASSRGFQTLLKLVKNTENCWVKLSSWYRQSNCGPPYEAMRPFIEALMETRPDRLIWGSNWPHPNFSGPMPNDSDLLQQIIDWAGSADLTQKILVDNPARLYRFQENFP